METNSSNSKRAKSQRQYKLLCVKNLSLKLYPLGVIGLIALSPLAIRLQAGIAYASTATSINVIPPCLRGTAAEENVSDLTSCFIGPSSTGRTGLPYWIDLLMVATMIAAFIYILIGAYQMVTAYGDEAKFVAGRKTVVAAVIGIIVATLALVFVNIFLALLNGKPISF